jgi:DNA mismatch repair protein MutL
MSQAEQTSTDNVKPEPTRQGECGGKIRLLPPYLINRIAAGEVVERPASVVKELVENALDAGATRIDISAGAGGRNIRVADNGSGMDPADAAMAFYNHATSKIRDEEDLDRIATLGFRGEALASIGSIARLTCLTRTADAAMGSKVTLNEQGEPVLSDAGCAPGTVMEIQDLFYNTPARLKFLKRPQTELGHIEETVQFLALSHPEVRFTLALNDKETLKTSGTGELKRTLEEIFALQRENIRLLPIVAQDESAGISLAGFASEPGVMKSSKRWMMTYVNGRHVRCPILQKSIAAAYESLLPHDRYPVCVLFFSLPPQELDVNVHPTKREVRYLASNAVFGFVKSGLRQSLSAHGLRFEPSTPFPASPIDMRLNALPDAPSAVPTDTSSDWFPSGVPSASSSPPENASGRPVQGHYTGASKPGQPYSGARRMFPSEPQSVQSALEFYRPRDPALSEDAAPSLAGTPPENALQDERFKVIGQLFNTYILLETAQGLLVVDQHIASERTFFEALSLNLTADTPDIQHVLAARSEAVSPVQRELLARHQAEFARLGFLYDVDEEQPVVYVKGYPLVYDGRDGVFRAGGLFENLLVQLEETGDMKLDLDHMIATLACHSAVRAGDTLAPFEMHTVVAQWLACRLPWTCPHGRPIAHTISKSELNHFFHRPSLPANAI